jgi:hypothetical protein
VNNGKLVNIFAAIGALLVTPAVPAGSANPTVTVVNTTANPVPVSGTISVANAVVPVEVRNADPIPVTVQGRATIRGHWFGNFTTSKSPVIFTVPAGKRFIVTDVIITAKSDTTTFPPGFNLLNECGVNSLKEVLGAGPMPDLYEGRRFLVQLHLTTGIALEAGDCFKVATAVDDNSATVTWFEENAN